MVLVNVLNAEKNFVLCYEQLLLAGPTNMNSEMRQSATSLAADCHFGRSRHAQEKVSRSSRICITHS